MVLLKILYVLIVVNICIVIARVENDQNQLIIEEIDFFTKEIKKKLNPKSEDASSSSIEEEKSNFTPHHCSSPQLLDTFFGSIVPEDYEEGQKLDMYGKVHHINETIEKFQRLMDWKQNVSKTYDPILKRLEMRITENLMSIDLPDPCLQSLVRISMAISNKELWAMECESIITL